MARRNEVRIIAGRWRGRKLRFPPAPGLRPTPGVVRETLFNWLQGTIVDARCLDLYAGSGALGFEAASRGAAEVVQVEANPRVARSLVENSRRLQAGQVAVVRAEVGRFLRRPPPAAFDLVFLDPPFGKGEVADCCRALEAGGWLTAGAQVYVEAESDSTPEVPGNWCPLRHKRVGEVGCHLYRREVP